MTSSEEWGRWSCTLIICLISSFLNTGSTKNILTSKCDGVAESRNGDFGLMDVTDNSDLTCEFHMSTLASMKRDLILFDTARMNCTGQGSVTFPTGRGQKNYCNQDKCLVYRKRKYKYRDEDVLATIRDVFPTCTKYDIRRKPIPKRIIATPETKAFTLRYKVLEIIISTTHASQDTTTASVTDHLPVTDQQLQLHTTTTNAIESTPLPDTTISAKDSNQQLRLHTTSTSIKSTLVLDTTASSKDSIGTPTSAETKPTVPEKTMEIFKTVVPESTTLRQNPITAQQTRIEGTTMDTARTDESTKAMHKYESTNEGIIADRNINTGIDNTSSASDNDITGLGVARSRSNEVQAWYIIVPIVLLLLIIAAIVIFMVFKRKDKKKGPEHTAAKSLPAQA